MKTVLFLAACMVCLRATSLRAQDSISLPTKSGTPASTPETSGTPAATPSPLPTNGLDLIPPPLPPPQNVPDISQLNQIFQQMQPDPAVTAYRSHVEWRQLKTRTEYDPAVLAAKASAEAAPTDLEKRNRLRGYYTIWFARMTALASSPAMVEYLKTQRDGHLALLDQPRVRPTAETEKREAEKKAAPVPVKKKASKKKKGKHRFLEDSAPTS
jgi:hypothetical protein